MVGSEVRGLEFRIQMIAFSLGFLHSYRDGNGAAFREAKGKETNGHDKKIKHRPGLGFRV
jgi:hypothetical protein